MFGWWVPRTRHWEFGGCGPRDLLASYRVCRALNIQQASPSMICLHETKLDSVGIFLALEFLGQSCTGFDFLAADSTRGCGMQSMTVGETKMAHSLAILTLWCIWKRRNVVAFTSYRCTPMQVFAVFRDECSLWASAGGRVLIPLTVANNLVSN